MSRIARSFAVAVVASSGTPRGVLEPHGFSVLHVEDLRRHYVLTLEHWRDRFERTAPRITAEYGERFTRMWRCYLAGAHAGFAAGYLQLFQVTFARRGWEGREWTWIG